MPQGSSNEESLCNADGSASSDGTGGHEDADKGEKDAAEDNEGGADQARALAKGLT